MAVAFLLGSGRDRARKAAEQTAEALRSPLATAVSVGVFSLNGNHPGALLAAADRSLDRAKRRAVKGTPTASARSAIASRRTRVRSNVRHSGR
jgi:hypothetical protein